MRGVAGGMDDHDLEFTNPEGGAIADDVDVTRKRVLTSLVYESPFSRPWGARKALRLRYVKITIKGVFDWR